jgi:hypothetical protein
MIEPLSLALLPLLDYSAIAGTPRQSNPPLSAIGYPAPWRCRIAVNIAKLPEPLPISAAPDTPGRFHLAAHETNYLSQKEKISSGAL